MKFLPPEIPVKGKIYFRDALTVESTETTVFEAILERTLGSLFFNFEGCKLCFDIGSLKMKTRTYGIDSVEYGDNFYGLDCTLSYFFLQEMTSKDDTIYFVSGVFDVGEGIDYRIFRIHGYFSESGHEISLKDKSWFN